MSDATLDPRALSALKSNQRQLDMDGVEVGVSRQALDELLAAYEALSQPQAGEPVANIVPEGCTGKALAFDPGVLHVNKDGSGYIAVDEDVWELEDDRCEGPDGPQGSVHWITRLPASEMQALRDFLNGNSVASPQPALAVKGLSDEAMETAVQVGRKAFFDYRGDESAISVGIRAALEAAALVAPPPPSGEAVEHMVRRFLQWKLPENFNPDGGISFNKVSNVGTSYEYRHEPVGTNLFDYGQAMAMVRHMLEGWSALSVAPATADGWRTMEDELPSGGEGQRAAFDTWWEGSGRRAQYDHIAEQAAYAAWCRADGWRTMDSAPTTGRVILSLPVYSSHDGSFLHWDAWSDDMENDPEEENVYSGWRIKDATHWMPISLAAAPTATGGRS